MLRVIQILFFLFPLSIFAQVNIINRSLSDSSLAFAYIGMDNEIEITGLKTNIAITASASNGTIIGQGQNRFLLRPERQGKCVLTFLQKEKKIAEKKFITHYVPDPMARFSNVNDSIQKTGRAYLTINLNRLINDPTLRIYAPKCLLKNKGQILSYRITYDGAGFEDQEEILVTGSRLSEDQVKLISKRFRNDTYMFVDKIRCVFPDGRIRKLAPLFYIVTK